MIEHVARALWVTALVLMGIGAVLMVWFYRRLRTAHHPTWQKLGEPSLFLNASILIQRRVSKFLWLSEYKELGDTTLDRIASVSKVLAVVTLAVIVAMFVLASRLLSG